MANIGKKILSAFIEIKEESKQMPEQAPEYKQPAITEATYKVDDKFKQYFDKLFRESNIPGPDYFEFTKMTEAMQNIPDESLRYAAAYSGLNVQGLDKQKLLSTAEQYIKLLEADAANFLSTVDAALKEKVHQKKAAAEEKNRRIQQLSQEIQLLQEQVVALQQEIDENEEKIETNTGGYKIASELMKKRIFSDIEKIKRFIQ